MTRKWIVGVCIAGLVAIGVAAAWAGQAAEPGTENNAQGTSDLCQKSVLTTFDPDKGDFFGHDVPIWSIDDGTAIMFRTGMTIDADGAPNAYNSANTGLDDLANAGEPGHWEGIVANRDGEPFLQGPDDPFPGFYVSQTSLVDWTKEPTDPTRYVDASKIPYIVLPGELSRQIGARLGDFAVVMNLRRGTAANAIFADIGTLGEGSIALADKIGIWSDAREGGTRGGILYLLYPGSGNHHPHSLDEINAETAKIFQKWGGMDRLASCATDVPHARPQIADKDQVAERNFH